MKILRNFLFMLTSMLLLASCSKSDSGDYAPLNPLGDDLTTCKTHLIPFEAEYKGTYKSVCEDMKCGDASWRRIVIDAVGEEVNIGTITAHFDYCCNMEEGCYCCDIASITNTNGDSLFFCFSGRIVEGRLSDHPFFVTSYWKDPFLILGGTGIFEGATGGGFTNDYNSSLDSFSHHNWKGKINLNSGGYKFQENPPQPLKKEGSFNIPEKYPEIDTVM